MRAIEEYDELEIETIAAAPLFADYSNCDDELQIEEYGNYGIAAQHYHNSGCGCLTLISAGLSLTFLTLLVVLAF